MRLKPVYLVRYYRTKSIEQSLSQILETLRKKAKSIAKLRYFQKNAPGPY